MMEPITRLYTKRFTMKEWDRFPWFKQEILCRKYQIIITDWIPKKQRVINKVNRVIDKTISGIDKMDDYFKKFDEVKNFKLFPTGGNTKGLALEKKDYSKLIG